MKKNDLPPVFLDVTHLYGQIVICSVIVTVASMVIPKNCSFILIGGFEKVTDKQLPFLTAFPLGQVGGQLLNEYEYVLGFILVHFPTHFHLPVIL